MAYTKPGEFANALVCALRKTAPYPTVTLREVLQTPAFLLAEKNERIFYLTWQKIEFKSDAPSLEKIDKLTTVSRLDLYYAGILSSPDSREINHERLREAMAAFYAQIVHKNVETIEQQKVRDCFDSFFGCDWRIPIFWLQDEIDNYFICGKRPSYLFKGLYLEWIGPDTTVKELLDFTVSEVQNTLN